eukprot:2055804-Alexandrium_andersonii.AAC.1
MINHNLAACKGRTHLWKLLPGLFMKHSHASPRPAPTPSDSPKSGLAGFNLHVLWMHAEPSAAL